MVKALDPWSYASKTRSEHAEQVALFMWAAMAERYGLEIANEPKAYTVAGYAMNMTGCLVDVSIPQLKWLHAVANHGAGYGRAAAGVKAGVADIFLPVPMRPEPDAVRIDYCGLYIELKRLPSDGKKAGNPSELQTTFANDMTVAGYKVALCYGWQHARDEIISYLGLT